MSGLKCMSVPHCCGAKFFFGFPTGYDERYLQAYADMPDKLDAFKKANKEISDILDKDLTFYLSRNQTEYREYKLHFVRETAIDRHTLEEADNQTLQPFVTASNSRKTLVEKNAWFSAILNERQRYVCEPVLYKHGFQLDYEEVNPNSSLRIYHYTYFPHRKRIP